MSVAISSMDSSTSMIMGTFTRTCIQEISLYLNRETQYCQTATRFGVSKLATSELAALKEISVFFNTILAQWMLPPEFLKPEFGVIGKHVDIYHMGLLLLSLVLKQTLNFTTDEILAGRPRQLAESISSRYSEVIARALRRHVNARTPSAIEMWREISSASATQ